MKDKEEPVNNEAPEKSRNEYEVPVKMIHPSICMSCPELEIENNPVEMWSEGTIYYINRLECKYYKYCRENTIRQTFLEQLKKTKPTHEEHGT